MTALALFLIVTSFLMAFLNFFPNWAPKKPVWLNKVYHVLRSVPMALGTFFTGLVLLFIFG